MKCVVGRLTARLLIPILLTLNAGCARGPATAALEVPSDAAISAGPNQVRMVIGITASPHLYAGKIIEPTFEFYEGRTVAAAMNGAEIGGGHVARSGLFMGQILGYPLGTYTFMASLLLSPVASIVGAFYGAVSEQSARTTTTLRAVEGAQTLFRNALDNQKIEEAIRDRVVQVAQETTDHILMTLPHERFGAEKVSYKGNPENQRALAEHGVDGVLDFHITKYGLAGEEATDPRVSLEMKFRILRFVQGMPFYSGEWEYRGKKRRLSVWAANGARLFREELDRVAQSLAGQFEKSLSQVTSETVLQWRNAPTSVQRSDGNWTPEKGGT